MKVKMDALVAKVLRLLGESPEFLDDRQQFGCPGTDLRTLIREVLPRAAVRAAKEADASEISDFETFAVGVEWHGPVAVLTLPSDCLRLLYVRMADWDSARSVFLDAGSGAWQALLRRQRLAASRFARRVHPSVALGFRDGHAVAEVLGSNPGTSLAEAGYLSRPEIDENGELRLSASLIEETVRFAAAEIRSIRGYD